MGCPEHPTWFDGECTARFARHLTLVFAAVMTCAASAETSVWIGGESGSVLDAANWDNGLPSKNALVARFTNSVVFATENRTKYWYPAGVELSDGITVTDNTRNMPDPEYNPDGRRVFDIGAGSKYVNNYVFYGKAGLTLVKKGAGTLDTTYCGSGNNRYRDVDVQEGTLYTHYSAQGRLMPLSNLVVRAGAVVDMFNSNITVTNGPLVTIDAGGLIDCGGELQTWPGLAGEGTVTNAEDGVRLTLEHSGKVFSGNIHGKLIIHPDVNFAKPGSYCVIGDADALAHTELEIVDVEGFGNPIRFASGIGVFYAKSFPDRLFYDVDGAPVTLLRSGKRWYVDASRTEEDGEGDGQTPETAFRTLKAAMENPSLGTYDTVYALPGVYSNGVMGTDTTLNRVIVPDGVWLMSRDGADSTFIVGAPATNIVDNYGGGTGAVRCVALGYGSRLYGFTLTDGRVNTSQQTGGTGKGGGVYATDDTALIVDCVLSNNVAFRGGAGHNGTWIRCRAYHNRCLQIGSVWNDKCNLYNCVTDRNIGSYSYYASGNPVEVVNCVFGPNEDGSVRATGTTDAKKAHFRNCVFLSPPEHANSGIEEGAGSVFHRCICAAGLSKTYARDDGTVVTNLSSVADRLAFAGLGEDLRPLSLNSRVVDAGNTAYLDIMDMQTFLSGDLDLTPRFQGGGVDIGAFEYDWRKGAASISAPDGGLSVDGAGTGANPVAEGESLTFTITRIYDSSIPCTGFTVNGKFVSFADIPDGWTWTVDGDDFSTAVAVEAVYERTTDWYVDPVRGDDSNPGYLPECPKRTLVDVMTNTAVTAGDTVWAAPGCYTDGYMTVKESNYIQNSRVVVKEGVTLKSTDGPGVTFIVGEASPAEVDDARGCGPGAIRCARLESGAVISGFTLTNGYTVCASRTTGTYGGGVYGGTAEDCVFRNCTGTRGGGAASAFCLRCRFYDNVSPYIGAAANACTLVNCFFSGHAVGAYTALNCGTIRNCTFLENNVQAVHCSNVEYAPENVCNSVILCAGAGTNTYTACLFSEEHAPADKWLGEGSVKTPVAETGLDDEGRPLSRTSAVVDAGDAEAYASVNAGDTDLDGKQRIFNGTIDIGCHEFDWRTDFAGALGSASSLSVLSASPPVTVDPDGGLRLSGDGTSLHVRRTDPGAVAGSRTFTVQVTGEGTLSVFRDGSDEAWGTVVADDGPVEFSFRLSSSVKDFSFVFAGDGSACISRFRRCTGTVITVK